MWFSRPKNLSGQPVQITCLAFQHSPLLTRWFRLVWFCKSFLVRRTILVGLFFQFFLVNKTGFESKVCLLNSGSPNLVFNLVFQTGKPDSYCLGKPDLFLSRFGFPHPKCGPHLAISTGLLSFFFDLVFQTGMPEPYCGLENQTYFSIWCSRQTLWSENKDGNCGLENQTRFSIWFSR